MVGIVSIEEERKEAWQEMSVCGSRLGVSGTNQQGQGPLGRDMATEAGPMASGPPAACGTPGPSHPVLLHPALSRACSTHWSGEHTYAPGVDSVVTANLRDSPRGAGSCRLGVNLLRHWESHVGSAERG